MKRQRHPKPTPEMEAGRIVRRAAHIIRDRGWIQGSYGGKHHGFCVVGGIRYAVAGNKLFDLLSHTEETGMALQQFRTWLRSTTGMPTVEIPAWNDTEGRTKEEVLLYLNKFADEVDPQRPR